MAGQILRQSGAPEGEVDVLLSLSVNQVASVRGDMGKKSREFTLRRGIRQGCPAAPLVFRWIMSDVVRRWRVEMGKALHPISHGVRVCGNMLDHLRFADDVGLVGSSSKELSCGLEKMDNILGTCGLEFEKEGAKLHLLTNDPDRVGRVYVEGRLVHPECEGTRWLGRWFTPALPDALAGKEDRARRIRRAAMTWAKNKHVILNRAVPCQLRLALFNACVSATLLANAGSRCWHAADLVAIRQAWVHYMARIFRFAWQPERTLPENLSSRKAFVQDLAARFKQTPWHRRVVGLRWEWAGHVLRMSPERWANRVSQWQTPVVLRRGRPIDSYWTQIDRLLDTKRADRSVAEDRLQWRAWCQEFVQAELNSIRLAW